MMLPGARSGSRSASARLMPLMMSLRSPSFRKIGSVFSLTNHTPG
jgi:hypothetical protein